MSLPTDEAMQAFEREYVASSGSELTVTQLHMAGRFAVPCDCGADGCVGFQMIHAIDWEMPGFANEMRDWAFGKAGMPPMPLSEHAVLREIADMHAMTDNGGINVCGICHSAWEHEPDCLWVRARVVLGLEATIECDACWRTPLQRCEKCDGKRSVPATRDNIKL